MKKFNSLLISGILFLSILIMINPVLGATHHVYPTDDLEDIIQNHTSAGDMVYVHAGTYFLDDPVDIFRSLTIIGDSPFSTIIDATSSGGNGISSDGISGGVTIKNITVKNANDSGIMLYAQDSTIENCITYGNGLYGIYVGEYSTIKNCLSYDNTGDGIKVNSDCEIINCTSVYNVGNGIQVRDRCKIFNSIFTNNSNNGFEVDSEGIYIYNSDSWDNDNGDWKYWEGDEIYFINCISKDPQFVTGRLGNFYLGYSSPSVDSGYGSPSRLGLYNGFTTRTDEKWDKGTVDMGFHYASNGGPIGTIPILKILEILKKNQI